MFNFFDFRIETYVDKGEGPNENIPLSGEAGNTTPGIDDGDRPGQGRSFGGFSVNGITVDSNGNIYVD